MKDLSFKETFLNSCVLFCDLIITGKESAAAIKFDEENMYVPMLVMLEKGASANALAGTAEAVGVPVVKNIMLARNLHSYGKVGRAIPELSYRDVSIALARNVSAKKRDFSRKTAAIPVKVPRPLSLELGASLFALTGEEPGMETLLARPLDAIRKRLRRLLGFSLPLFRVSCGMKLKDDEYRILFRGLEAGRGRMELGWYAKGRLRNPEGIPLASYPEMMNNPENIRAAAKAAASALVHHVNEIIRRRAPELLGRDEVEAILDAAEEKYPVMTSEVKSLLSLGIIREILQCLVSEQVSIRHIAVILETLADWSNYGSAPLDMVVEQIRQSLKRQICLEYADDRLTLRVLTLESKLDNRFADNSTGNAGKDPLAETGRRSVSFRSEECVDLISSAVAGMQERGYPPVILCSPEARPQVKEATRKKLPDLTVLSYMEIPQDISVEPLGEIRLEGSIHF